jgi:predicted RNase H-like HicB family nuclease
MRNEFSAIIEPTDDGWYWARSPEVPGANGQGRTEAEAEEDLKSSIEMLLEYLRDESENWIASGSRRSTVVVG